MRIKLQGFGVLLVLITLATVGNAADLEAEQFAIGNYKGKVVYLDFWASWCTPCGASFPWMQSMLEKYADQDLAVVAVNVDTQREAAERFLDRHSNDFDVVFDPEGRIASEYHLLGMPSSFLIGRDGQTLLSHKGFRSPDAVVLEGHIRSALEGATFSGRHSDAH